MAKQIPLTKGQVAIVDDEDYEWISQYKWFAVWNSTSKSFTAGRMVLHPDKPGKRALLRMHTMITSAPITDHKNMDTLDNRRANLRPCTRSQNMANRPGWGKWPKGVILQPNGRWKAEIRVNGKKLSQGTFDTPEKAHEAYKTAAAQYFGEFARTE